MIKSVESKLPCDAPPGDVPPRPKVLQLAYACNPERGSEQAVGWNRAVQSARFFDTWVITEGNHESGAIERYFARHGRPPGLHFVFVPRTAWEARLRRYPGLFYIAYNRWLRRACQVAQQLHKEHRFDLVHHVNIIGFREPGYLGELNAPLVWGPIGGTQNYPTAFLSGLNIRNALGETIRNVANTLQLRFSPRVRRTVRAADVLLVSNSTTRRDIASIDPRPTITMCETGIHPLKQLASARNSHHELRILWSGVFECRKALQLLLRALAQLPETVEYQLRILGRGPMAKQWKGLAHKLGVNQHIQWLGWLPRDEAIAQFRWADLFAFTSLRDTTGTVVLEALASGTPILCLDHQGVGDVVTQDCGVKVPVTNPARCVAEMAKAIEELAADRSRLAALSQGAMTRAENYFWDRQGEQMAHVYRDGIAAAAGRQESSATSRRQTEPAYAN